MKDKFMNGLLTVAGKMQANPVLSAIKDAFIDNMPIVIMGAFCTLFQFVVCTHADGYISLANIPGMDWLTALTPIFTCANYGCMNFMAVNICMLIAIHFAENMGHEHDNTVPAVALASFVTLITTTATGTMTVADLVSASDGALSTSLSSAEAASTTVGVSVSGAVASSYTSANGLFVGMLVGLLCTYMYVKLVDSGKLKITLPDSVPPNVSQSFAVLFPSILTILIVSVVGFCFNLTGHDFFSVITWIMSPLQSIMTGLPGYLVIVFVMMLLWWFGIHGPNVMSAVTTPFLTTAYAANNALYGAGVTPAVGASGVVNGVKYTYSIICNPFGSTFFSSTGSGITGGLIIAIMLFSKRDDYKAIAKLAIPCGIFNINEPIIFGIPMVMNPLLGIPFFLAPIVCVALGYLATYIGLCPIMVVDAPWTTPVGILGWLASGGHIMGGICQIVIILGASTLVYSPFVIAANRQVPANAETAEA
jgi:PTS system cellobiose-specific IIC component